MDAQKIEDKLDKVVGGAIEISQDIGGIKFESMMQVMEFAKMLSLSSAAIPKHLRNEPGACLGIVIQALEWRFSPYFVANKSYFVNDRLAYEAQLVHAVVLTRAPIKNQEAHVEYSGEGQTRKAKVWVELLSGGKKEYETPEVKDIKVQNSPLWKSDTDQQLFYYASRGLARRHFPHVLGGVYSKDELEGEDFKGPDKAKDVTPKASTVGERLKGGGKGRGFNAEHVQKTTEKPQDGQIEVKATETKTGEKSPLSPTYDKVTGEIIESGPAPDGKAGEEGQATPAQSSSPSEPEETVITPELIARNLVSGIAGQTDKVRLEEWQNEFHEVINALPPELLKGVRKALDDKHIELADQ